MWFRDGMDRGGWCAHPPKYINDIMYPALHTVRPHCFVVISHWLNTYVIDYILIRRKKQ